MSTALIILIIVAIPVAVLAFRLFQNRQAAAAETASTCGDVAYPGGTLDPAAWYIGPMLPASLGGTKSPGMPLHPAPLPAGKLGFQMDVPVGIHLQLGVGDKLDSLAFKHGPLTGKKEISMSLTVNPSSPDALLLAVPEVDPASVWPARVTIYFQRGGDDWSGAGAFEAYRWYFTGAEYYLKPGDNEITVPLDSGWTAVETSNMTNNPAGFKAAIDNCCCVGFGFGGNEIGRIHGMIAKAPVNLQCTRFEVS